MISLLCKPFRLWRIACYLIGMLALLPLIAILFSWLSPPGEAWHHIRDTMLAELLQNSAYLLFGVLGFSSLIGVILAWLLSQYRFPGQRFFSKALILPLAIPPYVMGFVYVGLLDYSGPIATAFRAISDSTILPSSRSFPVLIFVMTLALYPYVLFIVKTAFDSTGRGFWEVSHSLGLNRFQVFYRLALPMAMPWLIGALSLVGMETLADFGTVSVFVIDTFTTAIYKSWYGFFSPQTAGQLASFLLFPICTLYLLEYWAKSRQGKQFVGQTERKTLQCQLKGLKAFLATGLCSLVWFLGFLVPFFQLLFWAASSQWLDSVYNSGLQILNSIILAALVATVVVGVALILTYTLRFTGGRDVELVSRIATLGYAIPGAVLAIGVYLPLIKADRILASYLESLLSRPMPLLMTGTILSMVIGLSIRFMAVGQTTINSAQKRISRSLDEAAINFNCVGIAQLQRIHLPLIKKAIATAWVLIFIDVLKEMPLTLMTRPFGWDTLSVRVFEFISEGEWERASVPALFIVAISLTAIIFMNQDESQAA